jgi:acetyl esterase/lipase
MYNGNGLAFASVGYRSSDVAYFYLDNATGAHKREELIHVDPGGRLSLDTTGRTMADYKVRMCWQETITKPLFDAVAALEHIVQNSPLHNLDPHRIFFIGSSAGASLVNYLSFVHHKFSAGSFTPLGMALSDPQFDLPLFCGLDSTWKMWIDSYGADTLVSHYMAPSDCSKYIGSQLCQSNPLQATALKNGGYGVKLPEICNETWNQQTMQAFCGAKFNTVTFGDLYARQKWNRNDPQVGLGMEKLWYPSKNILDYHPSPFHMLVDGMGMSMFHNHLYVEKYAEAAAQAGVNFTVNTPESYQTTERFRFYYQEVEQLKPTSPQEHLAYVCMILRLPHCMPKALMPKPICPKEACLIFANNLMPIITA